jgi:hypothetical protein
MIRFVTLPSMLFLILAACTTPGARVVTVHSLPASFKGQSVFAMVVVSSKKQGIESRGFQRRLEEKLSSAGFRVVGEEERSDYIAMLTYGRFGAEEVLFGLQGEQPFFSNNGEGAGQGDVGVLQRASQQVLLELKDVNSGRSSAATYEVSDTSAFKRGLIVADTCRVFSEVMDAMLDLLFVNFPGQTGADLEVVDAQLEPACR